MAKKLLMLLKKGGPRASGDNRNQAMPGFLN